MNGYELKEKMEAALSEFRSLRGSAYRGSNRFDRNAFDILVADAMRQLNDAEDYGDGSDFFYICRNIIVSQNVDNQKSPPQIFLLRSFRDWLAENRDINFMIAFPPQGAVRTPKERRREFLEVYFRDYFRNESLQDLDIASVARTFWLGKRTVREDFTEIKNRYGLSGRHNAPALESVQYNFSGRANLTQLAIVLELLAAQESHADDCLDFAIVIYHSLSDEAKKLLNEFWQKNKLSNLAEILREASLPMYSPTSEWDRLLRKYGKKIEENIYIEPKNIENFLIFATKIGVDREFELQLTEKGRRLFGMVRASVVNSTAPIYVDLSSISWSGEEKALKCGLARVVAIPEKEIIALVVKS